MEKRCKINLQAIIEDKDDDRRGDDLNYYKRPLTPDQELLVWEKWVHIRQDETIKLGIRLNRPPTDLAMNLLKNVREDHERKTAIELAKLDKKPKNVRGVPFEPPARLIQANYEDPVYEMTMTRAQLGCPRVMEHVGVPRYIQETELGMSGDPERRICPLHTDFEDYRQKREEELKEKLQKIYPYRSSTSKLIIRGQKPKIPPPKMPPVPAINVIPPQFSSGYSMSGVYAVRINKSIFYKDTADLPLDYLASLTKQKWHENCSSWTYYFNVPIKKVGRGKIFMQNLGTVALRYCWKKLKRQVPYIPTELYEQVFFFNHNEDILSPGQCKDISLTFISDKPGIYNEYWELFFSNICFFDTVNEKIFIDLCADAVEDAESMKTKVAVLETNIHNKTVNNFAFEILQTAFEKVFDVIPQIFPYKKYFFESQVFLMKNPVCYYHQTEVANLSHLYQEMRPDHTWDLSIVTWRQAMVSKDYDERMHYFDILKTSYSELLHPWHEGDRLIREKHRAVNSIWMQLANNFDKDYKRLMDIYVIPERPSTTQTQTEEAVSGIDRLDPLTIQRIRNIFYLHAYDHVVYAIEQCAGILSSLDSERWIEFDFCRG